MSHKLEAELPAEILKRETITFEVLRSVNERLKSALVYLLIGFGLGVTLLWAAFLAWAAWRLIEAALF